MDHYTPPAAVSRWLPPASESSSPTMLQRILRSRPKQPVVFHRSPDGNYRLDVQWDIDPPGSGTALDELLLHPFWKSIQRLVQRDRRWAVNVHRSVRTSSAKLNPIRGRQQLVHRKVVATEAEAYKYRDHLLEQLSAGRKLESAAPGPL